MAETVSKTKTAPTPEEWARVIPGSDNPYTGIYSERYAAVTFKLGTNGEVGIVTPADIALAGRDRHALAALCLHEQPFGFTWEDVDLLSYSDLDEFDVAATGRLNSLADRIAALLPPRKPSEADTLDFHLRACQAELSALRAQLERAEGVLRAAKALADAWDGIDGRGHVISRSEALIEALRTYEESAE